MEGVKNRLKRSSLRHARTRFLLTPLFNRAFKLRFL